MNSLHIIPEPNLLYQRQVINLEFEKGTKRVVFELRYLFRTDKWYFSLFDAQTSAVICSYVPLVASYEYMNNLLEPFGHKNIGWLVCFPVVDEPSSEDPTQYNLSEFAIVWGDTLE